MRVLLLLVAVGLALAGRGVDPKPGQCGQVTCRCYDGQSKYSSYPTIKSCQIPNSDDWVASFIEDDCTWNPDHEFPAGEAAGSLASAGNGQYIYHKKENNDANGDCTGATGTTCNSLTSKEVVTGSGYFICTKVAPKCWYDPGRVENSVWAGKYDCADNDTPNPAWAGTTCVITCLAGFKLNGGPATCRGGKWIGFPRCDKAGCSGKPPMGKGMTGWAAPCTGSGPWNAGTLCDPTCSDGWMVGDDVECKLVNGKPQWSGGHCYPKPKPPPPPVPQPPGKPPVPPPTPAPKMCDPPKWTMNHGKWKCKKTPSGETCGYTCGTGFQLAGNAPICKNGKWDQQHPSTMKAKNKAHCACKPFQHIGPNTPPACVFGGYSGIDRVDFVADVSGSMNAGMKAGGKSYTRIAYLKIALKDAIDSLDSDQMFNIIKYSTTCTGWKKGVVKATKANKNAGDSYVNAFRASGGTNMHCGLITAEKDPNVDGIFLLTDGEPTIKMSKPWGEPGWRPTKENRRDPYGTIRTVIKDTRWNKKVIVNPISFFAPAKRYKDLDWVAKATKGKHHKIK